MPPACLDSVADILAELTDLRRNTFSQRVHGSFALVAGQNTRSYRAAVRLLLRVWPVVGRVSGWFCVVLAAKSAVLFCSTNTSVFLRYALSIMQRGQMPHLHLLTAAFVQKIRRRKLCVFGNRCSANCFRRRRAKQLLQLIPKRLKLYRGAKIASRCCARQHPTLDNNNLLSNRKPPNSGTALTIFVRSMTLFL